MIPLQDVKDWFGITGATYDAALTAFAARTLAAIERATDWYFGPARDAQEIIDAVERDRLFLRQPHIGTAAEFILEGRYYPGGSWDVIDAADYSLRAGSRIINAENGMGFWLGTRGYRATYKEGFEAVPGDIVQLALTMMSASVFAGGGDLKSETLGDYSYTRADVFKMDGWPSVYSTYRRGHI